MSGQFAETVYRDKATGKKVDIKLAKLQQRQEDAAKAEAIERRLGWGKGVAQTQQLAEKIQDDLAEMAKPLARYADDEDLNRILKNKERDGDPMAEYLMKYGSSKKSSSSSSSTQAGSKPKPIYRGPPPPPNRFNIRPGHNWDGVDRSNGFEKKYFERINTRESREREAYGWTLADDY